MSKSPKGSRKSLVFEAHGTKSKYRKFSLENPVITGALLVLFFAALTFLIGPSYRTEKLNFTPGEISKKTYVSRVPFTVMRPNPNLERERNQLAARVPTYYVFHRVRLLRVLKDMTNAFAQTRPVHRHYQRKKRKRQKLSDSKIRAAELQLETIKSTYNRLTRKYKRGADSGILLLGPWELKMDKARLRLTKLRADLKLDLERLSQRSEDEMRAVFLRVLRTEGGLNLEDVKAFIDDGFSKKVQHLLENSLTRVLNQKVVTDRRPLEQDLEKGIVWRSTPGGNWSVKTRELSTVTQQTARRMIDKLIRSRKDLFVKNRNLERACVELARNLVAVNFEPDRGTTRHMRTESRSAAKRTIPKTFKVSEPIVRKGDKFTAWQVKAIQFHHQLLRKQGKIENPYTRIQVSIAVALFILLSVGLTYRFSITSISTFPHEVKNLVLIGVILTFSVLMFSIAIPMARGLSAAGLAIPPEAVLFCVPVAFGAMIIRLFLNTETALVYVVLQTILVGLLFRDPRAFDIQSIDLMFSIPFVLYVFISGIVGVGAMARIKQRTSIWKAGLINSAVNVLVIFVLALFHEKPFTLEMLKFLSGGLFSGILAAVLLGAMTPIIEHVLKYTTDIKLLELANLNAPIFKELLMRAPGTYHHSVIVGNLAEAASEVVGANGLMCRVAAYYHDLGKMKNPRYFAENQEKGDNPHDNLKPHMSALIIKSHVKDGREIAKELKLNDDICNVAFQHHGTALIKYFYHKAKQQAKDGVVNETDFRYPGPRPQTREAGILMLADTTEAAAKSLPDPSPARLKGLVQSVINGHFTDGQLDECELTLKDLHEIAKAFLRVLNGIYHVRPQYPGQKKDQDTRKVSKTGEQKRSDKGKAANGKKESNKRSGETPKASASSDEKAADQGDDGKVDGESKEPAKKDQDFKDSDQNTGPEDIKRLGMS